ncbi:MAG: dockerin type I domain-containing protein [Candidatus Paceibacterota bacterium]|jgi:hypothetical protein
MIKKLVPFFIVLTVLVVTPSLSKAVAVDPQIQGLQAIVKTLTTQVTELQQKLQETLNVNQLNSNQLPRPSFACGDVNQNGVVDFKDAIAVADYYFHGNSIINLNLADADGNGKVDIYDLVYLVNYSRSNGPMPKCSGVAQVQPPTLYQLSQPSFVQQLPQPYAPVVIPNDNLPVCGDVNHDGKVNKTDSEGIVNYIFPGSFPNTGSFDLALANTNSDDSVDISDSVFLNEGGVPPVKCAATKPIVWFVTPSVIGNAPLSGGVFLEVKTNRVVAGVQYKIDGVNAAPEDVTAPYGLPLDTKTLSNGQHTLLAVARDSSGNTGETSMSVSINNGGVTPAPSYACGDVDHDGWVDMVDSNAIMNYIFPGSFPYTGTFDVALANINGKESVDISDVTYFGEWLRNHKFAPNCSNGPLPAQRIPQPPYTCGDVNHDGWVGITDTEAIMNYIFPGSYTNSGSFDLALANTNGDSSVDVSDAVYLSEWLNKHKSAPICGGVNSPTSAPKDYRVLSSSVYDSMKSQLDLISQQLQSLFR